MVFNPSPDTPIEAEDLCLLLGTHEQISAASRLFRAGGTTPTNA
jgi:K+/H+ antiporter YhaU regulatory subunit KhtT